MLENLKPYKRLYPCRIRVELEKLDNSDKKILLDAVADIETWPTKTLSNQLKQVGKIIISDTAITRHRKRLCSCEASAT